MENKELIINSNKDLLGILNRKEYTKLIINEEINPKLLYGFSNVKELEINKEKPTNYSKVEQNINSYPFINNLEKLNLKDIYNIGNNQTKKSSSKVFILKADNLKSINYIYGTNNNFYSSYIYKDYLMYCSNLEELVITFKDNLNLPDDITLPNSLKRIIIKYKDKEFFVPLEMFPFRSLNFYYNSERKTISLRIYNNIFKTYVDIDIVRNKINIKNVLKKLCNSLNENLDCLYIPDFIDEVDYGIINYDFSIKNISFNNNLLKNSNDVFKITDNNYLDLIETITIRYDNNMSLFPNKTINVKEYGIIKDLYIKDNKLFIVYDKEMLIVNKEGVITKKKLNNEDILTKEEIFQEKIKEENKEKIFELDKYSINELEEYLYYRKLLETIKDNNDEELINAVNVVGNKLVKKLNKGETHE